MVFVISLYFSSFTRNKTAAVVQTTEKLLNIIQQTTSSANHSANHLAKQMRNHATGYLDCTGYIIGFVLVLLPIFALFNNHASASELSEPASNTSQSTNSASNDSESIGRDDSKIAELSLQMFVEQGPAKAVAAHELASFEDKSLIPTFVLAMRWSGSNIHVAEALSNLAGETIRDWHEAYEWQERHPEIVPHSTYRDIKLRFLGNTDNQFREFFAEPHGRPENMLIRLEEVVWGGVQFDGIPSLDDAQTVPAADADFMLDADLVFGVEINGDARAYPLRILGWHEMANDVIGGVPVALAYCTLCGSGILYETLLEGADEPLIFGSSGLLYRSNKLMFDRESLSLWNQFTGEPVVGPLVGSGINLKVRPITITSWDDWRNQHPQTKVLSLETGYHRNYASGFVYHDYFSSPELMFPAITKDESQVLRKDYVFGIRSVAASKAWPLSAFKSESIINDTVGAMSLVLIGDENTRTVRAYERLADEQFSLSSADEIQKLSTAEQEWEINESFLVSADGLQKRARLPGHISYWFAWENFMGLNSELYEP